MSQLAATAQLARLQTAFARVQTWIMHSKTHDQLALAQLTQRLLRRRDLLLTDEAANEFHRR